jgi:alpha-beta hydrolase superfamily lysophospholipase
LFASFFLLAACGDGDETSPRLTATQADDGAKPTRQATPAASPAASQVTDEPVQFETDDGVRIKGHLYSVPGPQRRVVIFAHEFPTDQRAWQPFAKELVAPGVATFTFDFRGYGETGGARNVAKIDHDLDAAVRLLRSRDFPLIYAVGGSMGGTATLKVAGRQELAGVVLVSAPMNFMGLDARPELMSITERKLFVASRGDGDAADTVSVFMLNTPDPKQSQLFDGAAHGSELLAGANAAAFKQLLRDFLLR